jgi:hypothetical protein
MVFLTQSVRVQVVVVSAMHPLVVILSQILPFSKPRGRKGKKFAFEKSIESLLSIIEEMESTFGQ